MDKKLKIGVIGAGKFGGFHIAKCLDHKQIEFVGAHDPRAEVQASLAERFEGKSFLSTSDLLDNCEAVIIAAPASFHGNLALEALERGRHVLVEKPLATDLKSAEKIARLSKAKNLCVQVGHQERFVLRAIGLGDVKETPVLIKAQRLNPYSERGTDTSVTMDLMTHDIDLANWLMGGEPREVTGRTVRERSRSPDHSWAHMVYGAGEVFLEASRIAATGSRMMEITYPSGMVHIDFNQKTLRHDTPFDLDENFGVNPEVKDSLAAGTHEFVSAIQAGRAPFITAMDGLAAVKVALKVDGDL